MTPYHGEERRKESHNLTEEEMQAIAEKVEERLRNHLFIAVGRSVVNKLLYLVGVGALLLAAILVSKGHLP